MTGRSIGCVLAVAAMGLTGAGCAERPRPATSSIVKVSHDAAEVDCLARAMYFESHRGSSDGMLAVGTVVANRVKSGSYGATYCDVVSQKGQFAPGVMKRTMDGEAAERARRAAQAVLAGQRHPGVRGAMFFHTAGLRFPYPNMRYVLVAGGNAFYEKRSAEHLADARLNAQSRAVALAYAKADPTAAAKPIMMAALEPQTPPAAVMATVQPEPAPAPAAPAPVVAAAAPVVAPAPAAATRIAMVETPVARPAAQAARPATTAVAAVRTISPSAAPVLASVAPASRSTARVADRKTERTTPPAATAFAAEPQPMAGPAFAPASRVASGYTPVADAWASFQ